MYLKPRRRHRSYRLPGLPARAAGDLCARYFPACAVPVPRSERPVTASALPRAQPERRSRRTWGFFPADEFYLRSSGPLCALYSLWYVISRPMLRAAVAHVSS